MESSSRGRWGEFHFPSRRLRFARKFFLDRSPPEGVEFLVQNLVHLPLQEVFQVFLTIVIVMRMELGHDWVLSIDWWYINLSREADMILYYIYRDILCYYWGKGLSFCPRSGFDINDHQSTVRTISKIPPQNFCRLHRLHPELTWRKCGSVAAAVA